MSMSSPPLKNVICYLKQNRETQKRAEQRLLCKEKEGCVGRGRGEGACGGTEKS